MNQARVKSLKEAFELHPTRRAEWAELLREPVVQDVLAIIREKAFEPKPIPAGAGLMEWSALQNQRREGYLDCLTNLLDLARVSPFVAPPQPPWESPNKEQRLRELEQELAIPEDTRLPNSPVKPAPTATPTPANGPAPVSGTTTGGEKAPVT